MGVSNVGDHPLSATLPRPHRRERSVASGSGTIARMVADGPRRPPRVDGSLALVLDVAGTVLEFAPHPDEARVAEALRQVVGDLHRRLGGGLALVSGRPVELLV